MTDIEAQDTDDIGTETTDDDNDDLSAEPQEPNTGTAGRERGYRHRAQQAEAERDALAARVTRYETETVERLADTTGLEVAGDVWLIWDSVSDAPRDDDGELDVKAIEARLQKFITDRPGMRKRRGPAIPSAAAGNRQPVQRLEESWHEALRNRR